MFPSDMAILLKAEAPPGSRVDLAIRYCIFVYQLFDSRVSGRDHLHLHIFITFILFWQMEAHLGIAQSLGLAK